MKCFGFWLIMILSYGRIRPRGNEQFRINMGCWNQAVLTLKVKPEPLETAGEVLEVLSAIIVLIRMELDIQLVLITRDVLSAGHDSATVTVLLISLWLV